MLNPVYYVIASTGQRPKVEYPRTGRTRLGLRRTVGTPEPRAGRGAKGRADRQVGDQAVLGGKRGGGGK